MSPIKEPSDFFIFDLPSLEENDGPVDVVCFTAGTEVETPLLIEALERHIRTSSMPPSRLLLIGPEPALEQLEIAATEERVEEALPAFTRYIDTPSISLLLFDREGGLLDPAENVLPDDHGRFATHLLREGLLRIFQLRKGMLRTSPAYHYVNPSNRHTNGFIRTANVLLHSAEVDFIAMGLLKWWRPELRRLYVDTASISSVAYALTALRRTFEPDLHPPTIDSFSSYAGLRDFTFTTESGLCLVSASTSGGLEEKIVEKRHLASDRIVTLFYCGTEPKAGTQILCDLTDRDDQHGEEIPESFDSQDECALCRRGSAPVHISGDQFLPADPIVSDRTLTAEDAPPWLPQFLSGVVGEGIVRCHGSTVGDPSRMREVYVHLNDAVKNRKRFSKALDQRLKTMVPASLAKIVYVEHPSSKALAKAVAKYFEKVSGKRLGTDAVLGADRVLKHEVDLKGLKGPVMVIAGAASSGRTLLGISQFLRNVSDLDSIVYLIGVARPDSQDEWDRLRSSLTYGERPGAHPLAAVGKVYLPTEQSLEPSPWTAERGFLLEVREQLEEKERVDAEAVEAVDARRSLISTAVAQGGGGLTNDVFLPRVQNDDLSLLEPSRLKLRPGFVFWRSLNRNVAKAGSQADVYVTVLAILHRLRLAGPKGALAQHAHKRTVLSPANFARFNDGVVQAALLRAARPGDLDFSHNANLSAQMRDMIRRFIEHMNDDEGEAAPEFLLALAQGQLTLTKDDEKNIREFLQNRNDLPPFMRALRTWMIAQATSSGEAVNRSSAPGAAAAAVR